VTSSRSAQGKQDPAEHHRAERLIGLSPDRVGGHCGGRSKPQRIVTGSSIVRADSQTDLSTVVRMPRRTADRVQRRRWGTSRRLSRQPLPRNPGRIAGNATDIEKPAEPLSSRLWPWRRARWLGQRKGSLVSRSRVTPGISTPPPRRTNTKADALGLRLTTPLPMSVCIPLSNVRRDPALRWKGR